MKWNDEEGRHQVIDGEIDDELAGTSTERGDAEENEANESVAGDSTESDQTVDRADKGAIFDSTSRPSHIVILYDRIVGKWHVCWSGEGIHILSNYDACREVNNFSLWGKLGRVD